MNLTMPLIAMLCLLVSCASKDEVKPVETKLDNATYSSEGSIGVDSDNRAVVQRKRSMSAEVMVEQHVAENLMLDLQHEAYMLDWCRKDRADPRLGGSGETPPVPNVDGLFKQPPASMKIGRDENGNLVVVYRELYNDKIRSLQEYQEDLHQVRAVVKEQRNDCEYQMGVARVKHGLPQTRSPDEQSLDDAFQRTTGK